MPEGRTGASLLVDFRKAVLALSFLSTDVADYGTTDDATLLELTRLAAQLQRFGRTLGAVAAAEVAHRSAPELGSRGLAARLGHRTPEELVRVKTGSTGRDAVTAVRVGRVIRETQTAGIADPLTGEIAEPVEPWLAVVGRAITENDLSVAAADAIRTGLGTPTDSAPESALATAAEALCREAIFLDPDRLAGRAREMRNELDESGIGDREKERIAARGIRIIRRASGMGLLMWEMDPETLATVAEVYDRATSPRRGGPRFGPTELQEQADRIRDDDRTTQQIASDAFVQLLQNGAAADSSLLLGTGVPVLRLLVTASALDTGVGHGHIEGQVDPVSLQTVERVICAGLVTPIIFDASGQALDVGRELRLFNRKQRIALAARDGGCRWEGCERPPSWTESHHIEHWKRDFGKTDVADGLSLCKHHHLLLHNNGWEITRDHADYWLIPPADVDPTQTPRLLPSKSAAMGDLAR